MIATTLAPFGLCVHPHQLLVQVPIRTQLTRWLRQTLAVSATAALTVFLGCVAPQHGGYSQKFAHVLGFDCGCDCCDSCQCGDTCTCDDAVNCGGAGCPSDSCDIND